MTGPEPTIAEADVTAFRRDGAVALRGLFGRDWVERVREGIARNLAEPGPYARQYGAGGKGFFGDYCNWRRIPEYRDFVLDSPAPAIAARLMGASAVQFFHEHVLVKEAGCAEITPWHHDAPYYCVEAHKTVSIWLSLDRVSESVAPRFVAGSHAWGKLFAPRFFKDGSDYEAGGAYEPVPDIDAHPDAYRVLSWPLDPGDAVALHFRTLHGAPGNPTPGRRRALSTRWLGEDARYAERPQTPSPPYPEMGIGLRPGARMRADWFPVVWPPRDRT